MLGDSGYTHSLNNAYRLDLRNPLAPVLIPEADESALGKHRRAHLVKRSDLGGQRFAYLGQYGGFQVVNLETRQQVSEITLEGMGPLSDIEALMTPAGQHLAIFADDQSGRLAVVDLTDPAAPQLPAFVQLSAPRKLAVAGGQYISPATSSSTCST